MNEIGLVPTLTGEPGGRPTGQGVTRYPLPGGLFARACAELATEALRSPLTRRWLEGQHTGGTAPELGIPAHLQRRLLTPVGRAVADEALVGQLEMREQKAEDQVHLSEVRCERLGTSKPSFALRRLRYSTETVPDDSPRRQDKSLAGTIGGTLDVA